MGQSHLLHNYEKETFLLPDLPNWSYQIEKLFHMSKTNTCTEHFRTDPRPVQCNRIILLNFRNQHKGLCMRNDYA